ncbi:aldehyde dehydrogenase (NADP(+)) [Verrucomicrobiaceae bacterium N1E253]|uniref:Aldehyde dehydrogenase (NADP(+)) n=1 Tax=Oceaniferula marina TaxID=2748318 RepID=A0A851GP25_9BACT|nr:aldehyde dehydrogenase (NADP(+)) [Oceaniferula marina]NWK55894.1 aldehyde dehydrogenase (NADP(+)) [Oceaniferula marina]
MKLNGTSIIGARRGQGIAQAGNSINPATNEELEPDYVSASDEELALAVQLASEAFQTFRSTSGKNKATLLRTIADRIEASLDHLVARMPLETGLPEMRVRGEAGRTCGQLRMFAAMLEEGSWVDARIDRAQPDREPLPKVDTRSMMRPLGPVAVFAASNFPLAFSTAGGDTASALAAGCPVIVKAHSSHSGTAEIVGLAIQQAVADCGLPEGVFSLLYGSGRTVGQALVTHPSIKAVGFTGSYAGGRALMDLAAARPEPIPVYAEMSAINPVVILAELAKSKGDTLAEGLFQSLTLGVGQFCTNPGLVFIQEDAAQHITGKLSELVSASASATMLNAGICQAYDQGLEHLNQHDRVELLASGSCGGALNQAVPSVFKTTASDFLAANDLAEEVFGPATLLVTYGDDQELEALMASLGGQLTASVHGTDDELRRLSSLCQWMEACAGRLVFNGFPTGVEVCASMVHGGPFPATSDGRSTSVGTMSIYRFTRAVCWQDCPDFLLPDELKESNPLGIVRAEV